MRAETFLNYLKQTQWRLTKQVVDYSMPCRTATFQGFADFISREEDVLYQEQGRVTVDDQKSLPAKKSYIFRLLDGNRIGVYFLNGDKFHILDLCTYPLLRYQHRCNKDIYRGVTTIGGNGIWSSKWQVTGPQKDYTIHSSYAALNHEGDQTYFESWKKYD